MEFKAQFTSDHSTPRGTVALIQYPGKFGEQFSTMDQSILERLGFVKYLHSLASEQAQKPDPLAAVGLLMLHDSIELFLQLASEYLDVKKTVHGFMEYWEALEAAVPPDGLPRKKSMHRLNKARVNLKHHGIRPSADDLKNFAKMGHDFLRESTAEIFSIRFSEVTLSVLVRDDYVREKLKIAESLIDSDESEKAVEQVALGFHVVMSDIGERSFGGRMDRMFGMEPLGKHPPPVDDSDLATYLHSLHTGVGGMQRFVRLALLGVDLAKLWRFRAVTPHVFVSADRSGEEVVWLAGHTSTAEDARFCLNFAIETALRLQQRRDQAELEGGSRA